MIDENEPLNERRKKFLDVLIDKITSKDPAEWTKSTRKWEYNNNYGYNENTTLTNYLSSLGKLCVSIDRTLIGVSDGPVEHGVTGNSVRNYKFEEWQIRLYEDFKLKEWLVWSKHKPKAEIKSLISYFNPVKKNADLGKKEDEHFSDIEELMK